MEEYYIFAKNIFFAAAKLFLYSYAYLQVENLGALDKRLPIHNSNLCAYKINSEQIKAGQDALGEA